MSSAVRNTIVALAVAAGMLVSFFYLERAFRRGDGQRAIHAVQQLHAENKGPSLQETLVAEFGKDAQFTWLSKTEDNFRGLMLVSCGLPNGQTRHWRVDLIHGTVSELFKVAPNPLPTPKPE